MSDHAVVMNVPDAEVEFADDDQFIVKEIMRTGEWKKTPTSKGVKRTPIRVVRDGKSDQRAGIISLSELVDSFNKRAYQYVTIPLSDDKTEHKDLARLNTGFVKKLWIEDLPNGISKLKAKLHFTEPDVRGKVERGTIPDVSAHVGFNIERPDGEKFGSAIGHVCLSKTPFMDGLNPFGGLEFSDTDDPVVAEEIESFIPPVAVADPEPTPPAGSGEQTDPELPAEPVEPQALTWNQRASLSWRRDKLADALSSQLRLPEGYTVTDIAENTAIVTKDKTGTSWVAPYELSGDGVVVAQVSEWVVHESDGGSEQVVEPEAAPEETATPEPILQGDDLQQARQRRELRFRRQTSEGGEAMPRTGNDPLEGVDLSDPEAVKAAFARVEAENQQLRSRSRVGDVAAEIERVKELGFSDAPGFLATYRDILLSDDEEPAMVLFSHNEEGDRAPGTSEEKLTATQVAQRLIAALPTDDDGKVLFSGQALESGNDNPPPPDEGEERSVEERTRDAEEAIHGKVLSTAGKE